ncbi:MAG TPA: ABC transporter substrate-binding protein [Verrucomicrobiae bacterium]|jgi:iron complex transport system substrate-binding protein|nr:ABC transporter substrate-binding protein [Verrucomicrobiae bacterium]
MNAIPKRIVCLSAEAADWLWRIGAWEQVAGATSFFPQPAGAAPKPRVSGFSTARLNEIGKLNPDLIITFSDVQAEFAAELMKQGFPVLATNQRTLAETEATLSLLGRVVGRETESEHLLGEFRERLAPVTSRAKPPRVYFEEWNDPLISGIGWVGELIERAGGTDVFAELGKNRAARDRVVLPEQVCRANPEIILASWCGKPVDTAAISSRAGWAEIAAVREKRIYEIPGEDILQPGFRLIYGYDRLREILGPK